VTRAELEALAERALGHCEGEAQVTVHHERSLATRYARSAPTQATELDALTVRVTAVCDGHPAHASTTRPHDDDLRAAAHRARAAAEAAARAGPGVLPGLPGPVASSPPAGHGWDPETARLDPGRAARVLGTVLDAAAAADARAAGVWTAGAVRIAIASSTGLRAYDEVTDAFLKVLLEGPRGRSGYAAAAAVAAAGIDPAATAAQAASKLTDAEPVELPPGEYPVVLEADAVGELLRQLAAHAFNGLAHVEGRGALAGRLGTRVAALGVDLSDVPAHPATLPRAIDAEGVPKQSVALLRDGVAEGVVHDTRSAAVAGDEARSTGHAIEPGGSPDGPGPTNLVLGGGEVPGVAALAAPVERGLLVTRLWYVNTVDPKRTLLTGMTRDGTFLIEDGRVTRPLRDVRFTDEVLRILAATGGLGSTPVLTSEGELYGERFAYGAVCPPLRAEGFRVTGSAPR
jgi:predicted Zn-dependent protease